MRKLTQEEEDRCKIALAQNLHEHMLSIRDEWLILGDETGGLSEFKGKTSFRPSRMMWIAIPPHVNLPPLHPFYHGQDAEWFEDETINALKQLDNNDEVGCFIFTHEEGLSPKNLDSEIANKEHLLMWQFTLPLVLEWVASKSQGYQNVSIYIERVDPLVPGEMPLASLMQEFVTGLQKRKSWAKLRFKQQLILAKNPLEHLWLGYTDALGHIFNDDIPTEASDLFHSMKNKAISAPYRQFSLNSTMRQLLKDSSRPLFFLQSLHSLDANDIKDYVRPFFGNAIKESLDSLSIDEWQDLLEHIDIHSRDKKGQRATALVHDFIEIEEVLAKLDGNPTIQFDLLRMMLGTSNHRGAMAEGLKCKKICEEMLNSGVQITPEKSQKFNNLIPGLHDNMFDFTFNLGQIPSYSQSMATTEIHHLGTLAQSLGLTGDIKNVELAIQIEEKLASHGDDRRHRVRHALLHAELLLQIGKIVDAREILEKIPHDSQNSFLFATMLKCLTLGELTIPNQDSFLEDMIKLLDEDHPSQRIAYWFARWAIQNGLEHEDYTKICIRHLLHLREVPLFSHDAPGVILSCELMDLESKGYDFDFVTYEFFELVKSNSQPTTLEWLEKHPPNEENWLTPLNFNYC